MDELIQAILQDDTKRAEHLLKTNAQLVGQGFAHARLFDDFAHWVYDGDSALHLAAAAHRPRLAQVLLAAGADPNAAQSRRRATPLHYACDGYLALPSYDENLQLETIQVLIAAGGEINRRDQNGASPLHRAVRTRCATAVGYLLEVGSDPALKNKSGSTAFHLAVQNTGRGGSGSERARRAQRTIIGSFIARGISPSLKDGKGRSVRAAAKSEWIREMLE